MKYKIKVEKTLITDNKKNFKIGSDIFFTMFNKKTNHHDRIIGEIKEINDKEIIIKKNEINRNKVDGEMTISLDNIDNNSCNYVYYD